MPKPPRPEPDDKETRERWEHTALRVRMREGEWKRDAERRLSSFFHEDVVNYLPPVTLGFNLHMDLARQTATLYDGEAIVRFAGRRPSKASLKALGLNHFWGHASENQECVRAYNENFMRLDWSERKGRVTYRTVDPACIESKAPDDDPTQPNWIRELRWRDSDGEWAWETWDLRDRANPVFRVELVDRDDKMSPVGLRDITDRVVTATGLPGNWPYWTADPAKDADAEPIWPWTLYHSKVTHKQYRPYEGHELVDGTLTLAAGWTFWMGAMRDGSFVARWMANGVVAGAKNRDGEAWAPFNPLAVMMLKSAKTNSTEPIQVGQWSAPVDPEKLGRSLASFAAQLAVHAGMSASDVSVGSAGLSRVSGYAIEVSRAGKSRIERMSRLPMMEGDQQTLANAAKLANAYGGANLPTDPDAFEPVYFSQPRTAEELRAEVEEVTSLVDAGLMHPRDAVMRVDPRLTKDEAEQYLVEAATFRAALERVAGAVPEAQPEPNREPDTEEVEGEDEDIIEGAAAPEPQETPA